MDEELIKNILELLSEEQNLSFNELESSLDVDLGTLKIHLNFLRHRKFIKVTPASYGASYKITKEGREALEFKRNYTNYSFELNLGVFKAKIARGDNLESI
jgi:Mn-dependent DtxR family transcriptional regulator